MPKSRKNRRQRTHRRVMTELPLLQATDAAEARGDVAGALGLIQRDLESRPDETFWRPDRVRRLMQLAMFGPVLPRWATSRWILAQAAQHLDPRTRARARKAIDIAIETRGGPADRVKVMDHDWVHRQVWLYELGALEHFVTRVAAPDLLAGADRIHEWMRAPMGAFELVGQTPHEVVMVDLSTGDPVHLPNIGSASLLAPGECALGRLVPVEGGVMFESVPLFVPDRVADRVAEDPADWVAAVAEGCREDRRAGTQELSTVVLGFGLLSDVPSVLTHRFAGGAGGSRAELVGKALQGWVGDPLPGVSPWPVVAAALLEPEVFLDVTSSLSPADVPLWLGLAERVVEPAAAVCRDLAEELEAAA